jgi:hypothetical protein
MVSVEDIHFQQRSLVFFGVDQWISSTFFLQFQAFSILKSDSNNKTI